MASSSSESEAQFHSAEEDHVEDQSPDESEDEEELKKAVENTERNQVKGKKVMTVVAKKRKGNIGGDGDVENYDSEVDGKGKAKGRRKADKAINISLRGSASKVHTLFKEMSQESRERFSSCCFGHLIGMPPFTVNKTFMCAILRRYVKWDVFEFDGYNVRCSLRDIALITGLSVTVVVNPIRYDEGRSSGRLRLRYLGEGIIMEYMLLKAIRSLESNHENQECERDDLCKMHILYFISVFLLPNSAKNVDPKWIQLAEDFSKFNVHPWGFEVHRMLVDSFSHMFPRLGTPHFNAYGCLHVFTVWCYMHFPSLAPPYVDHVYPRLLAYEFKCRLKNKGGVGKTTLKTYETKVDKCLKKKNFVVQVEIPSEERQDFIHLLPTVEDDPVRGSNTQWIPKRSAAIGRTRSDGEYNQLLVGLTIAAFRKMMSGIDGGPIEGSAPKVGLCRKRGVVSIDIGQSTKKQKRTAGTSDTVLHGSPRKQGFSFPSSRNKRDNVRQEADALTTRANSSALKRGQPETTQLELNKKVPKVGQKKKMDHVKEKQIAVEELAEQNEIRDVDPKAEKPKESGLENGKEKEKEKVAHREKWHSVPHESVNKAEQGVEKPKEPSTKLVDTGINVTLETDRPPFLQSMRAVSCPEVVAMTTRASTSAVNCGQPRTTQPNINKKVSEIDPKKKLDLVEEVAEDSEIGAVDPMVEKPIEHGLENGKEKEEVEHREKQHGVPHESVNEAEQGVDKPKEPSTKLVDTGTNVTHETDIPPFPQSKRAVSCPEAVAMTTRASTSAVNCGQPRTTQPNINKKVSEVGPKKKLDLVEEVAEKKVIGDVYPKAEKPKESGLENGKEKEELAHWEKQHGVPDESVNEAEQGVDEPKEYSTKMVDTGIYFTHENDRPPSPTSKRAVLLFQEAVAMTTRASTSAMNCGQPRTAQTNINKKVPKVGPKKKMDHVEELAEEKESGDVNPKAQKQKDSGLENGKEKVELAHLEKQHRVPHQSVNDVEQEVDGPKESLPNLVDTKTNVTQENDRSPEGMSESVDSWEGAVVTTNRRASKRKVRFSKANHSGKKKLVRPKRWTLFNRLKRKMFNRL